MEKEQVLEMIRAWIVRNGNEEITADILRPILEAILLQPNDIIGNPEDLGTREKDTIVGALNEVLAQTTSGTVNIYTGEGTPNQTPPENFDIGDFYVHAGTEGVLGFYQYDGARWVNQTGNIPRPVEIRMGRVPTAGETTTETEIRNHANRRGFTVEPATIAILTFETTSGNIPTFRKSYFFTGTDTPGNWGTGSENGELGTDQLILNFHLNDVLGAIAEARRVEVGQIGENTIATYINANEEPILNDWQIDEGENVVFYYSQGDRELASLYRGTTPVRLGTTGETAVTDDDFSIVLIAGRAADENTLIPADDSISIDNENRIKVNVEGWNLTEQYLEKLNF